MRPLLSLARTVQGMKAVHETETVEDALELSEDIPIDLTDVPFALAHVTYRRTFTERHH